MKRHQDIKYLNWLKARIDNAVVLEKINQFNLIWIRQFLFRLLYFHEKDLDTKVISSLKKYLKITN
jgi:hypothetical protein